MIQIREKILSIYHSLNENPMSYTAFYEFMQQWDRKYRIKYINRHISAKDYIYIDKLYIKLQNYKPNLRDNELIKYNKDLARLAQNALTRIPWKNYIYNDTASPYVISLIPDCLARNCSMMVFTSNMCHDETFFDPFLPSDFRLDAGLKNAIAKGFPRDIYKPITFLKNQTPFLLAKLTSVVIGFVNITKK